MTILVGGYVGARRCTSGPTPGARNLLSWHLETFGAQGATNLGIYNCRSVRGGTTTSVHGEGRAGDLGCPTTAQTWSWAEAEFLRLYSQELGIQCVIHNHPDGRRLIWSSSGGTGWRGYSGVDHNNHVHAELTWAAANGGLTLQKLRDLWARHTGGGGDARPGDGILELGDSGESVRVLQRVMRAWYPRDLGYVQEDGDFGPNTERAVKFVQGKFGIAQDGVAGPVTLGKLGLAGLR